MSNKISSSSSNNFPSVGFNVPKETPERTFSSEASEEDYHSCTDSEKEEKKTVTNTTPKTPFVHSATNVRNISGTTQNPFSTPVRKPRASSGQPRASSGQYHFIDTDEVNPTPVKNKKIKKSEKGDQPNSASQTKKKKFSFSSFFQLMMRLFCFRRASE